MILVDIYVPSVDKTYDFHLNESARVRVIIEELVEMIGQKERTALVGEPGDLLLFDYAGGRALPPEATLEEFEVHNGSRLLLV